MTLDAAQVAALDSSIPRVTVALSTGVHREPQWTWRGPCGRWRFRAVSWPIPALHHEGAHRTHDDGRDCGDRLVVLLPPS